MVEKCGIVDGDGVAGSALNSWKGASVDGRRIFFVLYAGDGDIVLDGR